MKRQFELFKEPDSIEILPEDMISLIMRYVYYTSRKMDMEQVREMFEARMISKYFKSLMDRDILYNMPGPISESVLCHMADVHLNYFHSLKKMVLVDTYISDIALSKQTRLEKLSIRCVVPESSNINGNALLSLTNLKKLVLTEDKILDDSLSRLEKLEVLELGRNCQIKGTCFPFLKNLRKLKIKKYRTALEAQYCKNFLYIPMSVTTLCLKWNGTDKEIQTLTNLKKLSLRTGVFRVTDLALRNLTQLTHLSLRNNGVVTDHGLKTLGQLTSLNLRSNNNITSNGVLTLSESLKILDLRYNDSVDWSVLARLPYLETVYLTTEYRDLDVEEKYIEPLQKRGVCVELEVLYARLY